MGSPTSRLRRGWNSLREAIAGSPQDFTRGSLNRAVYMLAVPMVLEMGMESVFAVADAFFVSRLGADALATVGLAESMLTMVYGVALGISMGTTAMIARRIGEKRPHEASQVAVQAVGLAVVLALATGVPAYLNAAGLLRLMGASEAIIATGAGYTGILLGTNLVIMLLFVHNAIFRGAGDASFAMRALWLANGINLVLDPCLIFGLGPFPELGLTGAAVATTIGRGSGVIFQFWLLRSGRGRIQVRREDWRLRKAILLRLVRLSSSGAGQFLVATASWVALIRIVATFGSTAVAAYTLAIRIILFALLPAFGVSMAAATLVGQNLGAGNPRRAELSVWLTGLYTSVFLAGVTVLFLLSGDSLVRIFTQDPILVAQAAACLRVISYGYIFYAWGMVLTQAFNGAGDTMTPLWMNLACFWGCQIPLAWLLAKHTTLASTGVFWSVAVSETLLAFTAVALFRRGGWKKKMV
ncbi:MAG: MATE family efflux transporter [Acidobacteria bacterium]|nr:MATE family efflux transporter [Acidobacteriota bacterium]